MRALLPLLLLVACARTVRPAPVPPGPDGFGRAPADATEDGDRVPSLLVSDARDRMGASAPPAEVTPLPAQRVRDLLGLLPPLPPQATSPLRLPVASRPPVVAATAAPLPFPPPATPAPPDLEPAGRLAVLGFGPEGDVAAAPGMWVRFDRPMIPLGADPTAGPFPATLRPQPPGTWRWVGDRLLVFEAEGRLPAATDYALTVPADAAGLRGEPLGAPMSAALRTPPPSLVDHWPAGEDAPTTGLIALVFDQDVDADRVRAVLQVRAGTRYDLRTPTAEEIAADTVDAVAIRALLAQHGRGRVVVATLRSALPLSSRVTLVVPPGLPSAEGPRTTASRLTAAYRTHDPLFLEEAHCGWAKAPCAPGTPFALRFSTPLFAPEDASALLTVSPPRPGALVRIDGDTVWIETQGGAEAPGDTYEVTVSGALTDAWGQTLARPITAVFKLGEAPPPEPYLGGDAEIPALASPAEERPTAWFAAAGLDEVRLRIHRVSLDDVDAARKRWPDAKGNVPALPGTPVVDRALRLGLAAGADHVAVDVTEALGDAPGHVVVELEGPLPSAAALGRAPTEADRPRATRWVTVSSLRVSTVLDAGTAWFLAFDHVTGAARAGVEVATAAGQALGRTDDRGLLTLPADVVRGQRLVARDGADETFVQPGHRELTPPNAQGPHRMLATFDDRGLYRPGETAHLKGYVRTLDRSPVGDVTLSDLPARVPWTAEDALGNPVGAGEVSVDAAGAFAIDVVLPQDVALGEVRVTFDINAGAAAATPAGAARRIAPASAPIRRGGPTHALRVAAFRRPDFEVSARPISAAPAIAGEPLSLSASAHYYAGGGLAGAPVRWRITGQEADYTPPGWSDGWRFGAWSPPWMWRGAGPWGRWTPGPEASWTGRTDASGSHEIDVRVGTEGPPRVWRIEATAAITDVDRQTWTATATALVHPAAVTVGLRPASSWVASGAPLRVEAVVTDLDGEPTDTPAVVEVARRTWRQVGLGYEEVREPLGTCRVAGRGPQTCVFEGLPPGRVHVTASAADPAGRSARTELSLWVTGGTLDGDAPALVLAPDREAYEPGETARVRLAAPGLSAPALARVTLSRDGALRHDLLALPPEGATIEVPIADGQQPVLHVDAEVVVPDADGLPQVQRQRTELAVRRGGRDLKVTVQPDADAVRPGASTGLQVLVTDASGAPVRGARVAVTVADEAVLALGGWAPPHLFDVFHPWRPDGLQSFDTTAAVPRRADVALPWWADTSTRSGKAMRGMPRMAAMSGLAAAPEESGGMADGFGAGPPSGELPAVTLRADLRPSALWVADAPTDANGAVRLPLQLPDDLTRWRITAVAAEGAARFGVGEAAVTARLPLVVRPQLPRLLRVGDRAELSVVVRNPGEAPLTADVAVAVTGLRLSGDAAAPGDADRTGMRVTVPGGDRVELRVPVEATAAGEATLQAVVVSGDLSDAARVSFPVYTPATAEAFAASGSLSPDAPGLHQQLLLPEGARPDAGALRVELATTAFAELTDAVLALADDPFPGTEAAASRLIGTLAVRDALAALAPAGLPPAETLDAALQRDVDTLLAAQDARGRFHAFAVTWRSEPHPWVSAHATQALASARDAGLDVPPDALDRARNALRALPWPELRAGWTPLPPTLRAYALAARAAVGDDVTADVGALLKQVGGAEALGVEGVAHVLPWAADPGPLRRFLDGRLTETTSSARHATARTETERTLCLATDRQADGVALWARVRSDASDPVIPKLVRGLLDGRRAGRFPVSQEGAFALRGLGEAFAALEREEPAADVAAWLGDTALIATRLEGRSAEVATLTAPMAWLGGQVPAEGAPLVLSATGRGRITWRLRLDSVPADLALPAAARGLTVGRTYEAVDDPEDVRREADGTWVVRAGARVRSRVVLDAPAPRAHLWLTDPLPAGIELIDGDLIGTDADAGTAEPAPWPWSRSASAWAEHTALRDDRYEAYQSRLQAGVYEATWLGRATTPGVYVAPPAHAEMRYEPDTFGRSATAVVRVEAR